MVTKNQLVWLEYLKGVTPQKRGQFLRSAKKKNLKLIFDILLNVDRGIVPVGADILQALAPYKHVIHDLIKPKKSLKKRTEELLKKDYFHLLISPLIGTLQEQT